MSVDIRYVTNGTVTGYYVRNAMDETINFYDSIDKVPESLRSRAEKISTHTPLAGRDRYI